MIFIRFKPHVARRVRCLYPVVSTRLCSQYRIPSHEDDYYPEPRYPPIKDLSKRANDRREVESWYKKIERQSTIEEKLFEINMPRYWGWNCLMLREGVIPYNNLEFTQYITRTHVLDTKDEPMQQDLNSSQLMPCIKAAVEEELGYQLSLWRLKNRDQGIDDEKQVAKIVVNSLHRILMREIRSIGHHLKSTQVDYSPRIESFWSVGGIIPPDTVKERRKNEELLKDEKEINEPINRWVQYLGTPHIQIRHKNPLPPIWDTSFKGEVPEFTLDPKAFGIENEYRHGTSIPGFWPGDHAEFGVLSYHLCNHLNHRPPSYGSEDFWESLIIQGILASFGWLVPLAAYQGFSPFSEIPYPLVTQTVLTDGKKFSIMIYQMNTNLVHSEFATQNPKVNICWCSKTEDLYDRVEGEKILGLNEEVLKRLINAYLIQPAERSGIDTKPYLGKEEKRIADYEDEEKRCWLEREFKHFSANRPRHRKDLKYEIYEWERIYKINHQTRPIEPRRRPFELREHPFRRKMSDHSGKYIPRALRPDKDLPKYKQRKFTRTYYPE